jgi:hypothetical protein
MVAEPKIEFMPIWEIEGYHECYFFRDGAYHLKVKEDVVAIEVEGKLRNLVSESSSERRSPGDLDKKTDGFMVQRPKHFTIDKVVELAYQSRKARLYLDQKGNDDKEFAILRESKAKVESLSERTDLDDLVKNYLKGAVERKKIAFDKLADKIVKPPENFNKILSNRFEVSILNLYLVPFYVYRYRYQDKVKEIRINGVTGELLERANSSSLQS